MTTEHERSYFDQRRTVCESCRGTVSIPSRRRTLTLDEVMRVHAEACPGRGIKR